MRSLLKSKLVIGLVIFVTFFSVDLNLVHAQGQDDSNFIEDAISNPFLSPFNPLTVLTGPFSWLSGKLELSPKDLISKGAEGVYNTVVESAARAIATVLLWFGSKLLFLSAIAFNFTVQMTILGVSGFINLSGVTSSWAAFRDLANICFIFILLYISIQTILKGSQFNTKELLGKVILTAIILNFSLFFTKVVIDVSNILALSFYNKIVISNTSLNNTDEVFKRLDGGLATAFSDKLKINTLYNVNIDEAIPKGAIQPLILGIFGFILMSAVAISFFIATIMLISRLIMLIVYAITSPIAFMGAILPSTRSKITSAWWSGLIGQAFMAPVFFIFTWVTLRIIHSNEFNTFSNSLSRGGSDEGVGWVDIFAGEFSLVQAAALIFNYIIILGLIVTTIIITKKVSASSGGLAVSVSKSVGKFATGAVFGTTAAVGRRTVGGLANWTKESGVGKFIATNAVTSRIGGQALYRGLDKVSKSSFDARGVPGVGSLLGQGGIESKAGGAGGWEARRQELIKKKVAKINVLPGEEAQEIAANSKLNNLTVGGRGVKKALKDARKEHTKYKEKVEKEKEKHRENIGVDANGNAIQGKLTEKRNDARIELEQAKAEQRRLEKAGQNVDNQIRIVQEKQNALDEKEREIKKHEKELEAETKAIEERLQSPKNTRQRKVSDIIREEANKK